MGGLAEAGSGKGGEALSSKGPQLQKPGSVQPPGKLLPVMQMYNSGRLLIARNDSFHANDF